MHKQEAVLATAEAHRNGKTAKYGVWLVAELTTMTKAATRHTSVSGSLPTSARKKKTSGNENTQDGKTQTKR